MVDFTKRAAKAADGFLDAGEAVLAATSVLPSPFEVVGSAAVGGAIAGGVVGALVGSAVDKRREEKGAVEDASQLVPSMANRAAFADAIPKNGALLGVTGTRIIVWAISAMGKPKDVLFDLPLTQIDAVAWQEADPKWTRGSPKSTLLWIGVGGDQVLPVAAISMGPAGKYVQAVIGALAERLPGKVQEFTA
jgi:hypothetical protein